MAKRRSAELEKEIREFLARIPKKSLKTPEDLEAEIDEVLASGPPAERHEVARALGYAYPKRPPPKKMTVTDLNIFALADLVRAAGGKSTFSNRMHATEIPHIRRTLAGGLVEVSSPTTLTLTPAGHEAVLRHLRQAYDRKHDEQTRRAIENLEMGS